MKSRLGNGNLAHHWAGKLLLLSLASLAAYLLAFRQGVSASGMVFATCALLSVCALVSLAFSKQKNTQVWLLLGVLTLAWMLILVALWQLVRVAPAPGYELSIYDALPPTFLYALQASLALHVFVTARLCFRQDRDGDADFAAISGIAGVVFATVVVLSLPNLRGYLILAGDFSTHIGRAGEIASTWNIGKGVFYPALYALVQVVHAATGLDVSLIWFSASVIWYVLYVLLCIMVAGSLLADRRAALLAGLAAAIPVAGGYLRTMTPASVSVQLLPLLFYLYARSRRREGQGFNLLLVVLLVLFPFLHPLTSLMAVFWLALLELAAWVLPRATFWQPTAGSPRTRPSLDRSSVSPSATLILAVTWLAWISSFWLWTSNIRQVATWLTGEAYTQLAQIDYLADRSGLPTLDLAQLAFKQESGIIVYTGLALVSIPLFLILVRRHNVGERLVEYIVPLYALLALSTLAAGFAIVGPLGRLDLYRFARFLVPWSVLALAAVPLLASILSSSHRISVAIAMICAFAIVALGGFRALHPSPFVFQPNEQMTAQEVACMRWVYGAGDDRDIRGIWSLRRQAEVALGSETAWWLPSLWHPLPDHFGYDGTTSLEEVLAEPTYILVTEYDRATVLDLWASADKYTEEDFRRLEADPAAIHLYANNGCDAWSVQSGEKTFP